MKKLVTTKFREEIQKEFPGVKTEAHWQLLRTAFFSTYICKQTGAVRFGAEEIARAFDTTPGTHFQAGNKLKEFLAVLPEGTASLVLVKGKEWMKGEYISSFGMKEKLNEETGLIEFKSSYKRVGTGMQRRVQFNWSQKVKELLTTELNDKTPSSEKVYFVSGFKKNVNKERVGLKQTVEECLSAVAIINSPAAKYMAKYLNELPTNSFTKLNENADAAFQAVSQIDSEIVREQQLKILNAVLESPKPIYRPSKNGKTDRLFGYGANITNLKKEVRLSLTKDWIEFDLRSSQLAIVAKLWNIKELHDFLSDTTNSIWSNMYNYYGIINPISRKLLKDSLKERIYGIVFGESQDRIVNGKVVGDKVEDEGLDVELSRIGIVDGGKKFVKHPLMKKLLKCRQGYMTSLIEGGYVKDAFDILHEVNRKNVLSIMSRVAQSYEQMIIFSIFQLNYGNESDWTITLLQHDGVSIKFHDSEKKDAWIAKIVSHVNDVAKKWNIPTTLICEETKEENETTEDSREVRDTISINVGVFTTVCATTNDRIPYCDNLSPFSNDDGWL